MLPGFHRLPSVFLATQISSGLRSTSHCHCRRGCWHLTVFTVERLPEDLSHWQAVVFTVLCDSPPFHGVLLAILAHRAELFRITCISTTNRALPRLCRPILAFGTATAAKCFLHASALVVVCWSFPAVTARVCMQTLTDFGWINLQM